MNRETFEKQKPFAGEKKPSMNRRSLDNDYEGRQMYMVTMVTEGRRPLFGRVVGRSDGEVGTPEEPRCELSELGKAVEKEWLLTEKYHPEVRLIALQMMPDHLHGIIFVREKMARPLGWIIRGFKQSCNKHYRRLVLGQESGPSSSVSCVALATQHAGPAGEQQTGPAATQHTGPAATQHTGPAGEQQTAAAGEQLPATGSKDPFHARWDRHHGLLFAPGYNDRILLRAGQLETWKHYLKDNPRRLLMKREHPDLFRVKRNVVVGGTTFSAIGNLFLAQRPLKLQVQCSRRMTETEIATYRDRMLAAARAGAVLVSPSISPGEKAVMRVAFEEGLPLIYLQENGFTDLAKPGGKRMEACAQGQLLILAPWEHHNERLAIRRDQCLSLNEMARRLCMP